MNRMLTIVFDQLSQALDGRDALKSLDREGAITLYAYSVVTRKGDGTISVSEQYKHPLKHRTVAGGSIKSLISLLNRPTDITPGDNHIAGPKTDADNLQVSIDFIDEMSRGLVPGKIALLADVDEEWSHWIDLSMQKQGGTVYRCPLFDLEEVADLQKSAIMQEDLARMKAEHARASANRKAKLYEKMNALDAKIQQVLQRAKDRREFAVAKAKNKADVLEAEAAEEDPKNQRKASA